MEFSRNEKTMFATLGGGKSMDEANQLIQAPEEEEDFDILNEETFGGLDDGNFDWEDEHNRMACELEGSSFFDHSDNHTKDSGFVTLDKGYSSLMQEDELEQSINRLIVEDGDGKAFFTATGRPIPGLQSRLEAQYGAHMEYKSLGSPGKNIWGSPSTSDSPFQKPVNNTLQALFASAKQAAHRDFPGVFGNARAATPQGGLPAVPIPSEAPTLAEIEHNMLARENQKPKVLTAEEVERQLRGDPPLIHDASGSMPVPIPPVGTSVTFRKPSSNQGPPMPMIPMGGPEEESAPINIVAGLNDSRMHPGSIESPVIGLGRSPSPSPSHAIPIPPGMMAQQSPRLISPYGPAAAAVLMANRLMRPPPPPPNVVSPYGSPYGSPSLPAAVLASRLPGVVPSPMLDQQSSPRMSYPAGYPHPPPPPHHPVPHQMQQYPMPHSPQHPLNHMRPDSITNNMSHHHHLPQHHPLQQQHHHQPHPHPPYANDRYMNHHRGPAMGRHYQTRTRYDSYSSSNGGMGGAMHEEEDEYAGLMSKKEKDWIIKIQLMQLQTENPYLDDYYFTYHSLKRATSQQDTKADQMPDLELLIPSMTKQEPRTYTPAQFEGSLGRLTASSVHNPRQIIDVCRNNNASPTNDGQKNVSKELRRYRQLLMDIEKGFGLILDVDDLEKKVMALPPENRLPLFQERMEKIDTVYKYFMQDDSLKNFVPTLTVRKGRNLLARLMPLLDKIQWLSIGTVLLSHLPTLIRKDTDTEEGLSVLMKPLHSYLAKCNLECLVHFATILQKHPEQNEEGLALLLHNSFGISLLTFLLKAGEDIFKNSSLLDIDNQLKTQWHHFIEEFIETLEAVPKERLAWPATHQPVVSAHVDRFINNKQMGAVEDKLAHFSKPRPKDVDGVSGSRPANGSGGSDSKNKKKQQHRQVMAS